MGYGDELMSTGLARGARSRGKRAAFGDGIKIIFGPWSEEVFRHNPNVARPGDEWADDLEWIAHYKGRRLYNRVSPDRTRWLWTMSFRAVPGEMFFAEDELRFAEQIAAGFIAIEPNVPWQKTVAPNKDWGLPRYQLVADRLMAAGHRVIQFRNGRDRLAGVERVDAPSFRHALAVLARASLYIGPEGGLHHGAAAVGIPAVVLFGGFIPPQVTGYDTHTNLTGGATACGSLQRCRHCKMAMAAISVDQVIAAALRHLMVERNEHGLQRRVAGYHDIRMDGMTDLVIRAKGRSVFDIGCNRGLVAFEFANNGAVVCHGCDSWTPGVLIARELFADLRAVQSKFEAVDLAQPDPMKLFGDQHYDIVLMLATYHKIKRVMPPDKLADLVRLFGTRAQQYFAWRGTSDKPAENEQEIAMLDRDLGAVGLRRVHTSHLSKELGVAAVWERS